MGNNFAFDLAEDISLSLEDSISIHLQSNHYPPVPLSMVQPCIQAIEAINNGDYTVPIRLPIGVTWKGFDSAPANVIAHAHHLQAWIDSDE